MSKIEKLLENYFQGDKYQYKIYVDKDIEIDKNIIKEFIDYCLEFLKISNETENLKIVFSSKKEKFETFAFYDFQNKIAAVYCEGRATLDIFRSMAHELVHYKQDINNEITPDQSQEGNDGVPIENEANALAGVIMRGFGRMHKELY